MEEGEGRCQAAKPESASPCNAVEYSVVRQAGRQAGNSKCDKGGVGLVWPGLPLGQASWCDAAVNTAAAAYPATVCSISAVAQVVCGRTACTGSCAGWIQRCTPAALSAPLTGR